MERREVTEALAWVTRARRRPSRTDPDQPKRRRPQQQTALEFLATPLKAQALPDIGLGWYASIPQSERGS